MCPQLLALLKREFSGKSGDAQTPVENRPMNVGRLFASHENPRTRTTNPVGRSVKPDSLHLQAFWRMSHRFQLVPETVSEM